MGFFERTSEELRAFGCKIEGAGTESLLLQYRNSEKLRRRIVLGRFGVMTVKQARDEARIMSGDVARGPKTNRRRDVR